jgi:hypothetical protein
MKVQFENLRYFLKWYWGLDLRRADSESETSRFTGIYKTGFIVSGPRPGFKWSKDRRYRSLLEIARIFEYDKYRSDSLERLAAGVMNT